MALLPKTKKKKKKKMLRRKPSFFITCLDRGEERRKRKRHSWLVILVRTRKKNPRDLVREGERKRREEVIPARGEADAPIYSHRDGNLLGKEEEKDRKGGGEDSEISGQRASNEGGKSVRAPS